MRRKRIFIFCILFIMLFTGARFKEPNWSPYAEGQRFSSLPATAPVITGIYSLANSNQVDYKQPEETFEEQALQYKRDGYFELFYESNPTLPVAYATASDTQMTYPEKITTGVPAYDQYQPTNSLRFPIEWGQWLLNNGFFSRFNSKVSKKAAGGMQVDEVSVAPWGVTNSTVAASRDEFLVGLAKVAYGPIESRPIYFETSAYRYAKAVVWHEVYNWVNDRWVFSHYEYHEEKPGSANQRPSASYVDNRQAQDGFVFQQVSNQSSQRWGDYPVFYNFRGEFITQPEQYENSIMHRYNPDNWSYVTTDVWELYYIKLLSMGILNYNEAFDGQTSTADQDRNIGPEGDTFEFNDTVKEAIKQEYNSYGNSNASHEKLMYPEYAPELGIVVNGQSSSVRDIDYKRVGTVGVLGRNYSVSADKVEFLPESFTVPGTTNPVTLQLPSKKYMKYQQLTNMAALRMIERVLRVQEKNMSALEASIISKKYGAKYLDNLTGRDRQTVEYLIAFGIIDFENFDEYANLYSILSREFCYTLLYRLANPNARTDFSKLLLTDTSSATLSLPDEYRNYQNSVLTNATTKLDEFITNDGRLVKDPMDSSSEELSLFSSIYVQDILDSSNRNPIYHVILNMDDPMKYLYRGLPIVMTNYRYHPNPTVEDNRQIKHVAELIHTHVDLWGNPYSEGEYFKVDLSNMVGAGNPYVQAQVKRFEEIALIANSTNPPSQIPEDINYLLPNRTPRQSPDNKDMSGVVSVKRSPDTGRYLVDISIAANSKEAASTFALANIVSLTQGLLQEQQLPSVVSQNNSILVDTENSNLTKGVNVDNNLLTNSRNSVSAVTNGKVGLSNSSITTGNTQAVVNESNMLSEGLIKQVAQNVNTEVIGSKPVISVDSERFNKQETPVLNPATGQRSTAKVRDFDLKLSRNKTVFLNNKEKYYNVSVADLGDIIYSDTKFSYTDDANKKQTVSGTIVVELVLELPTLIEQNTLVGGAITSKQTRSEMFNWIYTRPQNAILANYWDYNIEVTNALLSSIGGQNMKIRSGFIFPKVTLLVDKPPTENGMPSISQTELTRISADFMKQVGSNLSAGWVNKYLGDVRVYNQSIQELQKKTLDQIITEGLISKNEDGTYNWAKPPKDGVLPSIINGQMPVWSEVYFNQQFNSRIAHTTFLHSRMSNPKFKAYPILNFDGAHKVYGFYQPPQSEGSPVIEIPFIKTDFNELYFRLQDSSYAYNEDTNSLRLNRTAIAVTVTPGTELDYNGSKWIVVRDTDTELQIVSKEYLVGIVNSGVLLEAKSNSDVLQVAKVYVDNIFGKSIDPAIDEKQTYNFNSFDTSVPSQFIPVGQLFADIINNALKVRVATKNGEAVLSKGRPATEGDQVLFRPFVSLSKSAWNIGSDGKSITWSKRLLGADYKYYSAKNNLLLLQSDIIPADSDNIIPYSELKEAVFQFGSLQGYKNSDGKLTVTVPFRTDFVVDGTVNEPLLLSSLSEFSTTVRTANGDIFSSVDYATSKSLASYDPNYTNYRNTLVSNNGSLFVANGTKLAKYNPASIVDNIALQVELPENASTLVATTATGDVMYAALSAVQAQSPSLEPAASVQVLALASLPDTYDVSGARPMFRGVDDATVFFNGLLDYTNTMRTNNLLGQVVWYSIALSVALSVILVLSRLCRDIPIIHDWAVDNWESTGIDIFKWTSLTLVQVEEEPPGWGRTILYSFLLVFVPTLAVALMKGFGIQFL